MNVVTLKDAVCDSCVSLLCAEAWGGRSANRGQCAQACRMPYGLIVDGVFKVRHCLQRARSAGLQLAHRDMQIKVSVCRLKWGLVGD